MSVVILLSCLRKLSSPESDPRTAEDFIIEDLLFRLRKETAITDGAKNMIKALRAQKVADHKGLSDVSFLFVSYSSLGFANIGPL